MNTENKAICRGAAGEVIEASWGRLVWTASRQVGNSQTMSFGRVTIRAGQENPRHRHPNCDEILHLLSGRLEHSLAGETFVLEAGDTVSIPQGVWHQARAVGEENAEIVICFSSADRLTEVAPERAA
jgi:quercetin dioxygenase-like cupin family protein